MLGLLLLYFIGKAFYTQAERTGRHQWGMAILGVLSYYGGTFIAGILLVVGYEFFELGNLDDISDIQLSFLALPFGILACWLLYKYLENKTTKTLSLGEEDILDDEQF